MNWMLIRIDDNGNMIMVADELTEDEATNRMDRFGDHKQSYFIVAYSPDNRAATIESYHILV